MSDQTLKLEIDGMSCASCVGRVEAALGKAHGVSHAYVNLAAKTAEVRISDEQTSAAAIISTITNAGYPARPMRSQSAQDDRLDAEIQATQTRLQLAALLTVPVVILAMSGHLVPAWKGVLDSRASWLIQFVLTTAVLLWPGRAFYTKGFPALFKGAPDMNTLVAIGTAAAWSFSTIALFAPTLLPPASVGVYFEAAAVIVTLILLGHLLEARAKGRTGDAVRKLIQLRPKTARILRDGQPVEIAVDDIIVEDLLQIKPGERLPVDGVVTAGQSYVDEAMLTGEPAAVKKTIGDRVTGGTINGSGALTVRAQKVGADTALAQIIQMVQDAQGVRLPIQDIVTRITLWFVPMVLVLAALTIACWMIFGPDPALGFALVTGVSVLIVACPCAMGLATPMSIMVGTGRAADLGVLFRKGDALQSLQGVRTVAFDKTGTVTVGRPEVTQFVPAADLAAQDVLTAIISVEALSEHPLAQAVVRYGATHGVVPRTATGFEAIVGRGAQAHVDDAFVCVGGAQMMAELGINLDVFSAQADTAASLGQSVFYAAIDGRVACLLAVSDPIKPAAKSTIAALNQMGLKTVLISGDTVAAASAVAAQIGITDVVADVLPAGKVAALDGLQGPVAFVGDGINDAPALAHAHVGIAIGTGTDVAIESADVVLMSGDISAVAAAFAISRATLRNIRQNLFWAFAYNAALIPVAAGVFYATFGVLLSPMLAGGAMALSSVFVVTNALRLRRAAA